VEIRQRLERLTFNNKYQSRASIYRAAQIPIRIVVSLADPRNLRISNGGCVDNLASGKERREHKIAGIWRKQAEMGESNPTIR
jgi:hypothetical protein